MRGSEGSSSGGSQRALTCGATRWIGPRLLHRRPLDFQLRPFELVIVPEVKGVEGCHVSWLGGSGMVLPSFQKQNSKAGLGLVETGGDDAACRARAADDVVESHHGLPSPAPALVQAPNYRTGSGEPAPDSISYCRLYRPGGGSPSRPRRSFMK